MAKILISYRRSDADNAAYRIRDALVERFQKSKVFISTDIMPFGRDFREHLKLVLKGVGVILIIAGPKWVEEIKRREKNGEIDYVRLEVEAGLQRGIPVILVLIRGAKIVQPPELPESFANIAFFQAMEIDSACDFKIHMDRLSQQINNRLIKHGLIAKVFIIMLMVSVLGLFLFVFLMPLFFSPWYHL